MIIDFHTHTFPDAIAQRAIAGMQAISHATAFTDGTVSGLQHAMADSGVCYSVVLPVATNPTKLTSINDVSIAKNGKDGLIYFAAMHPMAENWNEELTRLAHAGIKGIKIHPQYQGADITDIRFLRILGRAAELGLITVMHAGDDIGYPGIIRCSPEMTGAALRELGNIPLVLAHMGGWKNWERVAEHLADTGCMLDTAFSLGAVMPLGKEFYHPEELQLLSPNAFISLVRTFGSHRILFGTDSPWASQRSEINQFRNLALTQEEADNILYRNACQLLQIEMS